MTWSFIYSFKGPLKIPVEGLAEPYLPGQVQGNLQRSNSTMSALIIRRSGFVVETSCPPPPPILHLTLQKETPSPFPSAKLVPSSLTPWAQADMGQSLSKYLFCALRRNKCGVSQSPFKSNSPPRKAGSVFDAPHRHAAVKEAVSRKKEGMMKQHHPRST